MDDVMQRGKKKLLQVQNILTGLCTRQQITYSWRRSRIDVSYDEPWVRQERGCKRVWHDAPAVLAPAKHGKLQMHTACAHLSLLWRRLARLSLQEVQP